jgi:glutamine amidotransferase
LFLDPQPSSESPVAELVRHYPIHSLNVIAHIRKATQGTVALENTHPFMRELWGRYWIFAHNGNLADYAPPLDGSCLPVGQTDSERAFCHLLQELRAAFPGGAPDRRTLRAALEDFAAATRLHGPFNFILSNGDCLFAHRSTELYYIERKAPFALAHLKDQDVAVDFSAVTTPNDRVAIIATQPLTDNEIWLPLPAGRLTMFADGVCVHD